MVYISSVVCWKNFRIKVQSANMYLSLFNMLYHSKDGSKSCSVNPARVLKVQMQTQQHCSAKAT